MSLFKGKKINFGKEFDSFMSDAGCNNTGVGAIFDCAWFDALLAGVAFSVVMIVSQLASEKMKIWKKLSDTERYDWVGSVANWILSIITTIGSLYILSINDWYLDHPGNPKNNVNEYDQQLNFFSFVKTFHQNMHYKYQSVKYSVPWMIGYNIGRIIHVMVGLARTLRDVNKWDLLPHILHIILYGVILDQKRFGMIATLQMLMQSHHLYTVPMTIMEYTKKSDNVCYKFLDWFGFVIKFFNLTLAGPYCLAILWYHWPIMKEFSFFTQMSYCIIIGMNTLLFTGDIAFSFYWIACKVQGKDAKKWFKDFLKKEKREQRRLRKAGYRNIKQQNDLEESESEDTSDSDSDDVTLGQTAPTHTELTQRTPKVSN